MKKAIIIPIFKAGNKEEPSNYRPISILPLLSKIFEKLVLNRMIGFLEKHKIVSKYQYGFQKGRSTLDALVDVIMTLQDTLDEGDKAILLCIDLCKAFDTVCHKILIDKLSFYGFRGIINNWFQSYLSNRSQMVRVHTEDSEEMINDQGVPQGSILGPVMFLLYINDLPEVIEYGKPTLFADDSGIIYSGTDFNHSIYHAQMDINSIEDWATRNLLTINSSKTHYVKISTSHAKPEINDQLFICKNKIDPVPETKFLGIIIDSNCKWDKQVANIIKKIAPTIGTLAHIRHYVPKATLIHIYNSLIHSKISYAMEVWGGGYSTHLKPLQSLQNRALRHITFTNYRESVKQKYIELKIRNLSSTYNCKTATLAHKMVKKHPDRFTFCASQRKINKLNFRKIRNNYGRKSIYVNMIKLFNALPDEIRSQGHTNAVKRRIRDFF